jgi:hypothetical protein
MVVVRPRVEGPDPDRGEEGAVVEAGEGEAEGDPVAPGEGRPARRCLLPAGCSTAFAEVNTTVALARLRRFAQSMAPGIPPIDQALPAARELLASAGVPFKIVGGLAVIHHGYARTTEEIDLLVEAGSQESIDARLEPFGFARETPHRLRHRATGVAAHLLIAGEPMPRPGCPPYPSPGTLRSSPEDAAAVSLDALVRLKLLAGRHQDRADVVALLKSLDERAYLDLEAALEPVELRQRLFELRRDALEEASWRAT